MRAAIYLRVSRAEQNTDNQRIQLLQLLEHRGWTLAKIYRDHAISGATPGNKRPGFNAMMQDAKNGKLDVIVAWAVDRIGRNVADLYQSMNGLLNYNVGLVLHQQQLDTTTPSGKAMFGMIGIFAELERDLIRERVKAGLERAKASGIKLGRPMLDPKISAEVDRMLWDGLLSYPQIAGQTGASLRYVEQRAKQDGHTRRPRKRS